MVLGSGSLKVSIKSQSSDGWTGTGRSASKKAHSHDWQVIAAFWQEAWVPKGLSSSLCGPLHRTAWLSSTYGSLLPLEVLIQKRKQEGSYNRFYVLISESHTVISFYFYRSQFQSTAHTQGGTFGFTFWREQHQRACARNLKPWFSDLATMAKMRYDWCHWLSGYRLPWSGFSSFLNTSIVQLSHT